MKILKRIFDFTFSLISLVCLLPFFIIIALIIKIKLGSPILFIQERVGKDNKIFKIIKFRSMTNERNEKGELLPSNDRLTKFGDFLRRTSIDELPELINVIKGDMSLIGPRPLPTKYVSLYNSEQKIRHKVLPGISGLAQVSGRNTITWGEKFKLDLWYIENWSIYLDIKIFFITIYKVFKKKDIYTIENKIMDSFNGKN